MQREVESKRLCDGRHKLEIPIMEYYAGLDISLEETSVCIVNSDGKVVRETKVPTDPDALAKELQLRKTAFKRVGLEASALGSWLHAELTRRGFPAIVVEARHMRSSLNAQRNKTDRNDARGIAQMMRMGWFRAVHVKSPESQRLRLLLANRRLLKRKLIDLENHIRGALRAFGLMVGTVARGGYEERVLELIADADGALKSFIMTMLDVRKAVMGGYNVLHKALIGIVAADPLCRRFMTIPGVGPIAALSFRAGVDDPLRFTSSRVVGAHFGLTPRKCQSGTIDIDGRITKQGDVDVRSALCEAAASMLLRAKKWTALRAWGLRIAKRTSMKNAMIAVARKLATILHRMWIDGTEFVLCKGAAVIEKRVLIGTVVP
jgi:transposase